MIADSLQPLRAADRLIAARCDGVWSAATPTFLAKQLMPESSDRAGGFMKLRWTGGDIGVRTNSFVTLLTSLHVGILELFDRLRIVGGAFTATAAGTSCQVTLKLRIPGSQDTRFDPAWMVRIADKRTLREHASQLD
jgi:hypothetical protein